MSFDNYSKKNVKDNYIRGIADVLLHCKKYLAVLRPINMWNGSDYGTTLMGLGETKWL